MKKRAKQPRARKPPAKATPDRATAASIETMVAAVVRADVESDSVVAKELGVSASAIQKWRARLAEKMETAALLDDERARLSSTWRVEAELTLIAIARDHRRRTQLGEILTLEQIGLAKTWGEVNLVGSSMLGVTKPKVAEVPAPPPPAPRSAPPSSASDAPEDDEVRH
jgi:hypothetical protein